MGGATKELGEGIEPNEIKEGDTIKGGWHVRVMVVGNAQICSRTPYILRKNFPNCFVFSLAKYIYIYIYVCVSVYIYIFAE